MPLNPNDTLLNDQYRILSLLGRGGFGFVYQAQDTLLHREIAIKELIPALVGDEATLKRFLVEARATMELAHEQIVRTHNVFQEGGNYYIVMECMSGGSLEERLREKGSLPIDDVVRIGREVCAGLDYAHQRGIVHCDLKPANILFASNGTAKVADFGIAHVSDQMLSRSWMTPAGFVAGTLPYMSPEQADGVREDPRVDVYAIGAVLYRMLTGRTYLGFDQRETPGAQADNVLRIRNVQPVPPSAHNRRIPAWLDEVVLKALSKRPEERYGRAAEMQAALERKGAAVPVLPQAKPEAALAPTRQRRAHRPAWFWPVAGAATALLVIIFIATAALLGNGEAPAEAPVPVPTESDLPALITTPIEATPTLAPPSTEAPPTSSQTFGITPTLAVASPTLLEPEPFSSLAGMVTFEWSYPVTLKDDEAFQVLIWRKGDTEHLGAAQSWTGTRQTIDLAHVPTVQQAGPGEYIWSVVVVRRGMYERLGPEAQPRQFTYAKPTPVADPAHQFQLAHPPEAEPDISPCCYIYGIVRDAAGNGLENVQVVAFDAWATLPPALTRGGAESGQYSIPVSADVNTWYVMVVDAAGNQISPQAQILWNPDDGNGYRVDWQRSY